ncbi:helix-turn-helix domain-containing protein [Senegalimassilia sp.]|uniref:helix-turn-helix transcriptional regulator n=1 Tax=Senegalimassilia sp. TaxID=1922200 RepID=UPI00283F5742|nr:helix-turn-helix domain-containing protein [Senegalimassilia sp.]MDR3886504.1 helix-turn-helix domain-containing protein [Senegalimassilia sp.]
MGEKNTAAAKDRSLRAVRTPAGIANAKEARTADDGCGKPRQDAGDSSTNREKLPRTLTGKRERAWEPLGRTEALTGVALGCFLAWVPMTFQSLNIVGDKGEPVLDTVYLISICTLLLTQIIIGIEHRRCALWLAKRPARTGSAMAMAASTLLLPVAAGWADGESAARTFAASIALTTASGIVSGVSSGLFLAQFGILMSKFSAKATAAIAALGYLCMSALFCLFSFFGPFESCLFAASMPIASSFLRDVGASTQKSKRAINDKPLPAQIEPANPENRRQLRHLTLALALCCALIGCANELARTLYIQMGIAGAGGQHYAFIQAGAALVIGLGATIITLALVSMKMPRAPELCYRILVLFLALGALLLPTPLLCPISAVVPYALNSAAFQCYGILAWVLICGACHQYPATSVRVFQFVRAGWTFGPLIGMLIGRFVVNCTPFELAQVFPSAVLGAALVMMAAMAFTEHDLAFAVNLLPTDRKRRFSDKCLAVAARCGLSERETEIMTLFAKGRNLAYIQDQLCLSKSTVSTHRQHIYQKLGVHSSQEMIDLIQEEKA